MAFALDSGDRGIMSWVATTKGIDAGLVGDLMNAGCGKTIRIKRQTTLND
jgi:hypothetical protein